MAQGSRLVHLRHRVHNLVHDGLALRGRLLLLVVGQGGQQLLDFLLKRLPVLRGLVHDVGAQQGEHALEDGFRGREGGELLGLLGGEVGLVDEAQLLDLGGVVEIVLELGGGQGVDALVSYLVASLERLLDRVLLVQELLARQDSHLLALLEGGVEVDDLLDVGLGELLALVAQAAAHGLPLGGGVDELHLADAARGLLLGEHPDVDADSGVVEQVARKAHDGLHVVFLEQPAAGLRLARGRAAREERRAVGDDAGAAVVRKLVDDVLHEEQLHVARGRQAGREAAIDPLGLLAHGLLDAVARVLAAPGLAEGRVHEYEAHLVVGEAVLLHGVGKADVLGALALDEHVGQADGVGVGDDLLAVEVDVGLGAGAVELLLGAREHAARAAGEVAHLDDLARRGEVLAALREGKAREQADYLARGVVVAGLGVLGEAADDFLEHVAHGHVVDRLGVEVELGELTDDAGELGALPHLLDLLVKLEVGEDLLDVGREGVDVGLEVGRQRRGVGQELGERVAAGVVEGEPGLTAQDGVGHVGVCLVG